MKDYSSVINKIPLLGYIFLGKDGDIKTKVDINGTIDNPVFNTNTINDMFKRGGKQLKKSSRAVKKLIDF